MNRILPLVIIASVLSVVMLPTKSFSSTFDPSGNYSTTCFGPETKDISFTCKENVYRFKKVRCDLNQEETQGPDVVEILSEFSLPVI